MTISLVLLTLGYAQAQAENSVPMQYMPGMFDEVDQSQQFENNQKEEKLPLDLEADALMHDESTQTLVASGNVKLIYDGRTLKADEVRYNLIDDSVKAHGNVVLKDQNGDVHYADQVSLANRMKDGFVEGLETYLASGGEFKAKEGQRIDGKRIVMREASFTSCRCNGGADGAPAWSIHAHEVRHDEETARISYKGAKFKIYDIPVFYTPYLSHPDGTVDQKSGFLTPSFGFDSELGVMLTNEYYWAIDQDEDLTIGLMGLSREIPVGLLEYRKRFQNAAFEINGSLTHSDRTDDIAGQPIKEDDELRGHVFAEGGWDINQNWRAGGGINYASDDQYLRQYNIRSDNILESQIFVERFEDRNYAALRALAFQDLRLRDLQTDQPNVLPEFEASFVGKPNGLLGGRWALDLTGLGLQRDDGQDMSRLSLDAGWQNRYVTNFGLVNTLDLSLRGDLYHVSDRDLATFGSGRSNDGSHSRLTPTAHLVSSYPFVKPIEKADIILEPQFALTATPNVDNSNSDIPNEDSGDTLLDASNLFNENRFPGYDQIEDRARATYGLKTGVYGHEGSYLSLFGGQTYRFSEKDNPFSEGSGLDRQESDYVGQIAAQYGDHLGVNYRFQIGSDNLTSERHEMDAYLDLGRLDIDMRYLFAKALQGTDIDQSREQGRLAAAYNMTDHWRVRGDVIYDFGENNGMRESEVGLDYRGCCMDLSLSARRSIKIEATGESGTDILFRIGFKGIGAFGDSGENLWQASTR